MKAVYEYATVQGNLDGERIAMKFDENSIAHIMSVLTDLYSDPELAVIREYSTNALDANLQAGNSDPIEVTLPSALSPFFRVKDRGVGLSVEDIHDIYSKYGASTKRDSDDVVGMLGLGCKSGLTYTNSFTLNAVKDGVKTQAMVSRIEDGTGVVEIVDTRSTNEPNGLEVVVPAKFAGAFHNKAMAFFRFWEPGTVLVNGAPPAPIEGLRVTKDTLIVEGLSSDFIVMGNVAYPVTGRRLTGRLAGYNSKVVAWVPIGAVNFTPSREALHYTKRTEATILDIKQRFDAALAKSAQDNINAATTPAEAYKRFRSWSDKVSGTTFNYKGQAFPTSVPATGFTLSLGYRTSSSKIYNKSIYLSNIGGREANLLVISEFEGTEVTTAQRKKIKAWMQSENLSYSTIYVIAEKSLGEPWVTLKTVTWDTIKAFRLPRQPKGASVPLNYDIWSSYQTKNYKGNMVTQWAWKNVPLVSATEVIYFSPADEEVNAADVQSLFPKATVLKLQKNRWQKFARENKGAMTIKEALESIRQQVADALTDEDILALTADYSDINAVENLDPKRIDDPELAKTITLLQTVKDLPESDARKEFQLFNRLARQVYISGIEAPKDKNALAKYPLVRYNGYDSNMNGHIYEYVNGVFSLRQKEGN